MAARPYLLQATESPIAVQAADITYLMADAAQKSSGLMVSDAHQQQQPKRFWVEQWRDPAQFFEWPVEVTEAGDYEVTLMVSAPFATPIKVHGPKSLAVCEMTYHGDWNRNGGYNWDRIRMPMPLSLPGGKSTIRIQLGAQVTDKSGAALKSMELLNTQERPEMDRRLQAFRPDTAWMAEAKFGFMCQCGEWSYPEHGAHKPWPGMAAKFNVPRFVDMVDSTGAGYVVWSATWATYYFPAPIAAIDGILPGERRAEI